MNSKYSLLQFRPLTVPSGVSTLLERFNSQILKVNTSSLIYLTFFAQSSLTTTGLSKTAQTGIIAGAIVGFVAIVAVAVVLIKHR